MVLSKFNSIRKLYIQKKKWRKLNKHNETNLKKYTDIEKIEVGKCSYGPIECYTWGSENEKLIIKNYVSIANGVKFILGGNHRYNTVSTYPFKVKFTVESREAYSNGAIVVEDDVWIGMDSKIMSGVTIGKGAVVAAGSVVSKNVKPYSIVGGNPAKFIKYRFDEKVREELMDFKYENLEKEKIKKNLELLYEEVTLDNLKEIKKKLGE